MVLAACCCKGSRGPMASAQIMHWLVLGVGVLEEKGNRALHW